MRILMVNYEFPPILGGAANATRYISKELVVLGHSVNVVTSRVKGTAEFEILDGVKVYRVPAFIHRMDRASSLEMLRFIFLAVKKINFLCKREGFDLIHYFFSIPTGLISFFVDKRYPYIVSLRGSDVPGYDPDAFKLLHKILKPVNIAIWKRAKKVVALSEGLKKIAQVQAPQLRFDVIHNGVDDALFCNSGIRRSNPERIKLICVSRLLKRKGIHHLLEALSQLSPTNRKLSLLIVGTGSFEGHLKELVEQLGLKDTVSFYERCPYEELYKLYNAADIFVLPSLTESFGMVFVEAMACGLPIIATKIGGIPEVVADGKNGILVSPGNVNELRDALLKMITDNQLRSNMGLNSLRRAKELFSWRKIASMYFDVYKGALN